MSRKTVDFKMPAKVVDNTANAWVGQTGADIAEGRAAPKAKPPAAEPMKRFTIDVPASLHRKIKAACAAEGNKMADVLRSILEREFAAKE